MGAWYLRDVVSELSHSVHPGAACTAEEITSIFETVTNNSGTTALTEGSELINGTLKAVEGVDRITFEDLKILIVGVPTVVTSFHGALLCLVINLQSRYQGGKEMLESLIPTLTLTIELAGIGVILLGILYGAMAFLRAVFNKEDDAYEKLRHRLGRSILLGLELLVAGDIINTVAIEPTVESVMVLGGIVLIRTFLSFSLEVELDGNLPWRRSRTRGETTGFSQGQARRKVAPP